MESLLLDRCNHVKKVQVTPFKRDNASTSKRKTISSYRYVGLQSRAVVVLESWWSGMMVVAVSEL